MGVTGSTSHLIQVCLAAFVSFISGRSRWRANWFSGISPSYVNAKSSTFQKLGHKQLSLWGARISFHVRVRRCEGVAKESLDLILHRRLKLDSLWRGCVASEACRPRFTASTDVAEDVAARCQIERLVSILLIRDYTYWTALCIGLECRGCPITPRFLLLLFFFSICHLKRLFLI